MLSRRHFLSLCAAAAAPIRPASAQNERGPGARSRVKGDLRLLEVSLEGPDRVPRKALILTPAHGPQGQRYPALLLLHGRAEVADPRAGIHAWHDQYGLGASYAQLRRPPLRLDAERAHFMRRAQLTAINTGLSKHPFAGLVLICPVTPNPHTSATPEQVLVDYADWIEHALLPRVSALAPVDESLCLGLDGCSLGGYVAAELFVLKPHLFSTLGMVQAAFGQPRVAGFAQHLARAAEQPGFAGIHLQTSSADPFRRTTEALAAELTRLGTRHVVEVLPGPHTKRWLRSAGSLAMLAWQERTLRERLETGSSAPETRTEAEATAGDFPARVTSPRHGPRGAETVTTPSQ